MIFIYFWIAAQIIVEMLPVSSSTHLYVLQEFFKKRFTAIELKDFYYFLHLPTLIIITAYFGRSWLQLVFDAGTLNVKPFIWVIIADGITGISFLLMRKSKKEFPVCAGLCITAAALWLTAWSCGTRSIGVWQYHDAIILGFAQSVALLPGISRLAFTCSVGCLLGFSLVDSFFLSWLIYAPLMAVACAKSILDLYKQHALKQLLNLPIALVIIISGVVSYLVLIMITMMITTNTFFLWGWYLMLPLALCVWLAI